MKKNEASRYVMRSSSGDIPIEFMMKTPAGNIAVDPFALDRGRPHGIKFGYVRLGKNRMGRALIWRIGAHGLELRDGKNPRFIEKFGRLQNLFLQIERTEPYLPEFALFYRGYGRAAEMKPVLVGDKEDVIREAVRMIIEGKISKEER
jgi:hypothetical protein